MLTEPEAQERQHSARLCDRIRADITRHHGWIGFDQFMQQALYAPRLGYYQSDRPKFAHADDLTDDLTGDLSGARVGARVGDYVTAPLLGDVLARCLARQCVEVLSEIGHGTVLEFGAGSGHLAADLLRAMDALGRLPDYYFILETSALLRARQQETIAARCGSLGQRVHWLEQLPPDRFDGVVIANEVLDAMPATRFAMQAGGIARALGVALDGDQFHWAKSEPLPKNLQERLAEYDLTEGYQSEMALRAEAWVRSVGEKINTGVLLLIDYGFPAREFYHHERRAGTLMCHYRHVAHDNPFFYPGLQDISVHIDFTAISRAAQDVEMAVAGFTSQGAFLLSLGALDFIQAHYDNDNDIKTSLAMSQEIQKLTMPHEMGELFKVLALSRNYSRALGGFSMKDRRGRL